MIATGTNAKETEETVLFPGVPGLRRHVRIVPGPDRVTGEVSDDYHHFFVELRHDGRTILDVTARPLRYPYSICSEASGVLADRLKGTPLAEASAFDPATTHCTHQYDLALATADHANVPGPVLYRAFISDPDGNGRHRAFLDRNGETLFDWTVKGHHILAPAAFAGRDLKQIRHWAEELPRDLRWPAKILRRAGYIAEARQMQLSDVMITQRNGMMAGACYTLQPERMPRAMRNEGYVRDWSDGHADPLGKETWRP